MKIEWIIDESLPDSIIRKMEKAASRCTLCEEITVPCSVTVRLCDDETIENINADCRNIRKATDVLSFPTVSYPDGITARDCENLLRMEYDDENGCCFLGDIVISVPHIYLQAEEYGHSADREAMYLLIHGICHLMGYDHILENDKKKMRAMEERILLFV